MVMARNLLKSAKFLTRGLIEEFLTPCHLESRKPTPVNSSIANKIPSFYQVLELLYIWNKLLK